MKILLTGGTGLIGRHLMPRLLALGHTLVLVTRQPENARRWLDAGVELWPSLDGRHHLDGIDAVINLAGAPIADKRWSQAQKQRLCHSRWHITQQLVDLFQASSKPPAVLLSGSAVGYYGDQGSKEVTEEQAAHDEFTHQLCQRWEHIALGAHSAHSRVCLLRTGVVLTPAGGMLARILPLFKLGLGGPMGSGCQYLAWIHGNDMSRAIIHLLTHDSLSGPFNMTAPNPVTHAELARTLAKVLRRPAVLPAPALAVRLLMGEAAALVLAGQRALPARLQAAGFVFDWPKLEPALQDLLC